MKKAQEKKGFVKRETRNKTRKNTVVLIGLLLLTLLIALLLTQCDREVGNDTDEGKKFQQVDLKDQRDIKQEIAIAREKINDKSNILQFSFMQEAHLGEGKDGIYIGHNKNLSQEDYLGATIRLIKGQEKVVNQMTGKKELQNSYEDISYQIVLPKGKEANVTELTKNLPQGTYKIAVRYVALEPIIEIDSEGVEEIVDYKEKDKKVVYHTPVITLYVW